MTEYKIVAKDSDGCTGCIFAYEDDLGCTEPMEFSCNKNIWVLEEI